VNILFRTTNLNETDLLRTDRTDRPPFAIRRPRRQQQQSLAAHGADARVHFVRTTVKDRSGEVPSDEGSDKKQ